MNHLFIQSGLAEVPILWGGSKRPITDCITFLNVSWIMIHIAMGMNLNICVWRHKVYYIHGCSKIYLIQFFNFFLDRVFSGLGHICSVGIRAGQPRLRAPHRNRLFTPCHIYCVTTDTVKDRTSKFYQTCDITLCSNRSYSSSGWSSWHCQSLLHLHRFVWLPLPHVSLFSRRKT